MNNVNENVLFEKLEEVNINSEYVHELTDELVKSCSDKLDAYIEYVANKLNDTGSYNLTNAQLDDIVMAIPTLLYFVGTQQEKIGLKHDVSKQTRNKLYNKVYSETVGAVGVKKAAAEQFIFYEDLVTIVLDNAYQTLKSKVTYATEILQSAKKIMSRRMTETELSRITPNRERIITNE